MDEPSTSTSTHSFKRYIWEDYSHRRALNREKSEQQLKEWLNAPDLPDDPKPEYLIGPGEARDQISQQTHHGKDEKTIKTLSYKSRQDQYVHRKARQREQGLWPDEIGRDDEILHVRSTYVDK